MDQTVPPPKAVHFRGGRDLQASAMTGCGHIPDKPTAEEVHGRVFGAYALVLIRDGAGIYEDDGAGSCEVGRGDVLVIFPDVRHSYYRGPHPRWSESFLVFQGRVFAAMEQDGLLNRAETVLRPGPHGGIDAAFDQIIQDFQQGTDADQAQFPARIHLLLATIVAAHARNSRPGASMLPQACALLESDGPGALDLPGIARSLGMDYERFRKAFVRAMGMPPARYRVLRRIDRAKVLLAGEGLSLAAVADRLGYCDAYFFARQFKQVTGRTPGRFRADFHPHGGQGQPDQA